MLEAASARHSLHYVSTSTKPGLRLRIVSDVGRGRGIQRITITTHGQTGPATVLIVDRTAYIKGNSFTLDDYFGFTPAQAKQYAGQWISIPSSNGAFSALAADATFASFLSDLLPKKNLSLVRATLAGKKVVGVRGTVRQGGVKVVETVYAPAAGTPLPVQEKIVPVGKPGAGLAVMSKWNEPVRLAAPAHAVPISVVIGG